MRPMLQAEAAECGLACLAMIAHFHGHRVNLAGIRRDFAPSMKGTTLGELIRFADQLQLGPRPLRLDLDELNQLRLPAILHWDLDHFVVLERVRARTVTILDPAIGRVEMAIQGVSDHFTGVALELQPTEGFRPREARITVRLSDLYSRLGNYKSAIVQVLGLSLLLQFTALVTPFFLQLTIDEAVAQGDLNLMLLLGLGFGFVFLLNALVEGLRSWVVLALGESIAYQLGANIVRHLVRLPLAFFERRHVGDLQSRLASIRPIENLLTQGMANVFIDSVLALTTLTVMFVVSVPLTLVTLVFTAVFFGISLALFPRWRQRSEEGIIARAAESSYLLETMRAMRSIKLHGSEGMRELGWRNKEADVVTANYRTEMFNIRVQLIDRVMASAQFVAVVYLGAQAVIGETMTLGVLLAFMAYRASFTDSATKLVGQVQQWRMVGLHLERLSDIVGEAREEIGTAPARQLDTRPAAIRVEGLGFAYSPSEPLVLDGVSFEVPAGGFLAVVGASGSGKTTLMRLLLGLLIPTSGRILIDGVPLGPATIAAWRARIGAVLQDDVLLTGTLSDNIAFFDPRVDMERVELCARFARVHDDIVRMPMGYSSLVGDMGSALSGGQRQRLLLARAVYRRPDALFLDEGTANLDETTEGVIADSIGSMPLTRIVIAHRPALIERATTLLMVQDGTAKLVPRLSPIREALPSSEARSVATQLEAQA